MNIDWSKAPEGFDFHFRAKRSSRANEGEFYQATKGGRFINERDSYISYADMHNIIGLFVMTVRPQVAEWNGEGLPPVGTDVEVFSDYSHPRLDRFIGRQVHIVAHDVINGDPVAVFRMPIDGDDTEQDYHAMVARSFRPIRTPERIAAEEREAAICAMMEVCSEPPCRQSCTDLYDAGYRKLEIVDGE